ncbi:MAG: BamA/TamA family outer membrane protein [Candidatus Poribacteria bacterium]
MCAEAQYQREGYELSLTQIVTPSNSLALKFRDDDYRTVYKQTDWSIFNGDEIKRENLPADDGRMRSIILSYEFDSRNRKQTTKRHFHLMPIPSYRTTNGWRGTVSVEYAKSPLGAELNEKFDFALVKFEITRYNRLSQNQFLDFHLKGAIADNPLPLHYKFYLGGIGSLRGYKFHEFASGDKMILANVEYKIADKSKIGFVINPIIFADTGYVWEHDETAKLKDLKTDVGLGLQLGNSFRLNIAKPIEKDGKLRLNARLKRAF